MVTFFLPKFKNEFDAKFGVAKGESYRILINIYYGYEDRFVPKPEMSKYFQNLPSNVFKSIPLKTASKQFKNHLESADTPTETHSFFFKVTC